MKKKKESKLVTVRISSDTAEVMKKVAGDNSVSSTFSHSIRFLAHWNNLYKEKLLAAEKKSRVSVVDEFRKLGLPETYLRSIWDECFPPKTDSDIPIAIGNIENEKL